MSFQDVGRNNSRRQPANATYGGQATNRATATTPSSGGWGGGMTGSPSSSTSSVTQISEALLQYQVGDVLVRGDDRLDWAGLS